MITTGFEQRVKVQQIIENQLPEFILSENPKFVDFLKQYYISQEYQGGPSDIVENLDQYLKLDNFTPEVIVGVTTLSESIIPTAKVVRVESTKGFPNEYGLFQINDEIFTYTGITTNTFTGCVRGFSGITKYKSTLDPEELVFSSTDATSHSKGASVKNLSSLFLKEFYKKVKYLLTPGLEDVDFVANLNVNNFIKEARSFYQAKGTEESFRILFNVLYGIDPKVIDLENYLTKPSTAKFLRREIIIVEQISGEPNNLVGQTIIKSTDPNTKASVSEVEIFTRTGTRSYYKLGLFLGYDDKEFIDGIFNVQPKTRVIGKVSVGSSVITVDSTVGFGVTGTLISGNNKISYADKTINQFLSCTGINNIINSRDDIRNDDFFYGYENGDSTKIVKFRIGGVLSGFKPITDIYLTDEGERIYVKHVGEIILNPTQNKTYKELFANTLVYNTSSSFEVKRINTSVFTLESETDKSNLKVGDTVDILQGSTETVAYSGAIVANINQTTREVTLNNLGDPNSGGFKVDDSFIQPELDTTNYRIRRKLNTATSSNTPIFYGNNVVTSDIQNFYNDSEQYFYVASNSLPSYQITKTVIKSEINSVSQNNLKDFNTLTQKYQTIAFDGTEDVPFITGDEIYYSGGRVLVGLETGNYFVKVLTPSPGDNKNKIKLYQSRTLIDDNIFVEFALGNASGTKQTFTLFSQKEDRIYPQKSLKKFPSNQNIKTGKNQKTVPGTTGILINGVEIQNYKSTDKIYYGPLEKVKLYSGGTGYDIINPPVLIVTDPIVSSGTTALVSPVISGSVEKVFVDPQDFDIADVSSVTISGGNGSGAVLKPIVEMRQREIEFDARQRELTGGSFGINSNDETIMFSKNPKIVSGTALVYDNNGNDPVGIATSLGSANNTDVSKLNGGTLVKGTVYYAQVVGISSIKLYANLSDLNSGINTVGLTTAQKSGIHKFKLYNAQNTLRSIKVLDPGSGYQHRSLKVTPSGISTQNSTVNFSNHGFVDGDKVIYTTAVGVGTTIPVAISGLTTSTGITSTTNHYYILKVDNDSFRLSDAGIGGTNKTNYTRRDYINLPTKGSGYQVFSYPNIELTINVSFVNNQTGTIVATPYLRGKIIDTYLYEKGSGYGSKILNLHKRPNINIAKGTGAEFKPIVSNGRIIDVQVTFSGSKYTSEPDLIVEGDGVGAKLRSVVTNGKVTDVIIINSGLGYIEKNTFVYATVPGLGAIFEPDVRSLTVNNYARHGEEILSNNVGVPGLGYNLLGYYSNQQNVNSNDTGTVHSPIIGWAYDGNPIYGPTSISDPNNLNSSLKYLNPGYILNSNNVIDRPSEFAAGFFVEDYLFNNSGDLDQYNGRFTKTPEFPNGVYAYFATISNTNKNSIFPYFIGNSYRSLLINQNINQSFDFNNSNLIRNTFPYKVYDLNSSNDFILEPNEIITQSATIESVKRGPVDNLIINQSGEGYKIGDIAVFDDKDTDGTGLSVVVSSVKGKKISSINTTVQTFPSTTVIWKNSEQVSIHSTLPHGTLPHGLNNEDKVIISRASKFVFGLTNSHLIGISTETSYLIQQIPSNAAVGFVTDIYVTTNFSNVSAGSTLGIGATELVKVLNLFPENKVIRILRGQTGFAHTISTPIFTKPDSFTIELKTPYFESKLNDIVYFNPTQAIGIATNTGLTSTTTYKIGEKNSLVSIPSQSIYLPGHPFKTNQLVTLVIPAGGNTIAVSTSGNNFVLDQFNVPQTGTTQNFYVINKSPNYIGLTTQVGLTTSTNGLYFVGFTPNQDSLNYQYFIKSNFNQITAKVQKATSTVAVSTAHGMNVGDIIKLSLKSNRSVGLGTTATSIKVIYNSNHDKILIDPIGFTSIGVNTSTNQIQINSHNFETGDKVFYNSTNSIISGLQTGPYYIYRIDDDNFNLAETYNDSVAKPPVIVSLASTGGNLNSISKINPQISLVRNNDLVFDVSDSSLSGYKLKLFYDEDFNNEFVSTGTTSTFSVIGVGTVGISTNASLTLTYNNSLPPKLYYSLEKTGFISTSDKDVVNYSEILFVDSLYSDSFAISGVGIGSTSFQVQLNKLPELYTYTQNNTDTLEYSTTSSTEEGGIAKLKILSGGISYKKLPKFKSITSTNGINADIIPQSSVIGRINQLTIDDPGFDFSVDRTLSPEVFISPLIIITNRNEVTDVEVTYGGSNYTSTPDLVIVNPETGTIYDNGVLKPSLSGTSISSVTIVTAPAGLSEITNEVYAINNSNGIKINNCFTSSSGIVTCRIATPLVGFTTDVFTIGEKVFVEGIQNIGNTGKGFNSKDHKFQFFTVSNYTNGNPAEVTFNLVGIATDISANALGIAVTAQNGYATIIKKSNYPIFKVTQSPRNFALEEKLLTREGSSYIGRDLIITKILENTIKVYGTYELKENDVILGRDSGTIATIKSIQNNRAFFELDYSLRKDSGWSNDVGKLNDDTQIISDNDYYQNLSYTVKSSIEFEDLKEPVNSLLHTTGLKNFADTEIIKKKRVGFGVTNNTIRQSLINLISEIRVDTINNFDFGIEVDTLTNKSKFIQLKNKKLTDYIKCISNRVLTIDDISSQFNNTNQDVDNYVDLLKYNLNDGYNRFLIQIVNPFNTQRQVTEVITLPSGTNDIITIEKASLYNSNLGDVFANITDSGSLSLRFNPLDPYNSNYDIKILKNNFNGSLAGVGTQTIGFINLTGSNNIVGVASTSTIISSGIGTIKSLFVNAEIINTTTEKRNYFELYVDHDGTDTNISQYYVDNTPKIGFSTGGFIGSFSANISSGVLSLDFTNSTENNSVLVRSKVVGFGTTSVGVGTYTFTASGQPAGTQNTAKLQSNYEISSGISTLVSVSKNDVTTIKTIARVSYGNTSALHQILSIHDGTDAYVVQYPFLSGQNTTGIGTFSSELIGDNFVLKFYPDDNILTSILIQTYNEIIQTQSDSLNIPQSLTYGTFREQLNLSKFNGINGNRSNVTNFDLTHKGIPIFEKTFNPSDTTVLNPQTGTFTIANHFFQNNEELIYTPGSTFSGVSATSVGIGTTIVGGAVFLGDFIVGFSTITGISTSTGIAINQTIIGPSIAAGTTVTGIGTNYTYFIGNVVDGGSTVITGIGNTTLFTINAGIFSGNGTSLGTITNIGINSITASISAASTTNGVFYATNVNTAITISNASTSNSTRQTYTTGISTNILPETVYAIKIDNSTFRLSGSKGTSNVVGAAFTFTNTATGNAHQLEMRKKLEKSVIVIDGIVQSPISYTPINYTLINNNGQVSAISTHFAISGISSIVPKNILKIDDEFIEVISVGLGTTSTGPITGIGTFNLIQSKRGFVGTLATTHTDGTEIRVHTGSFNIVNNRIHFTEAPKGNLSETVDNSNIPYVKSTFGGRVYLRKDYTKNLIYDNISNDFTGIGQTYKLSVQGSNITGIETGSGLLFINNVFQTPTTSNNANNNYRFIQNSGISSVVFTGITTTAIGKDVYISPFDVNQNQLPRGGVVVSLASTPGLGFAPLVGASVTAVVSGGAVTSVGLGTTDINGSGYRGVVSIGITDSSHSGTAANITATVGAGGTLSFNVVSGGTGYVNPKIFVSEPNYENLSVIGVSRLGIGTTTTTGDGLLLNLEVGASSTTGIGSTLFEVKSFKISRPGYGFKKGDVFKPVGLVTDKNLSSPLIDCTFEVLEIFNDSFSAWQFGELDYIDSIKDLQNGSRVRFPLVYNGDLLSFEKDENNAESVEIDLNTLLLIFVNGVIQNPGANYEFDGGSSFIFTIAPTINDKVDIFFYRGTRNEDSRQVNVTETVKSGDTLKLNKNDFIIGTIEQKNRTVVNIRSANKVETDIYTDIGIDSINFKPINWTKQKVDKIIANEYIHKSRDSIESLVYPTAKVIGNLSILDTEIFVDDAQFFNYEENDPLTNIEIINFGAIIVGVNTLVGINTDPVGASFTATVSAGGTISGLTINTGGSGYSGATITLSIAPPKTIGVGIGTTATATATIGAGGTITSTSIINPGFGYTTSIIPNVLAPIQNIIYENISKITTVQGFAGIITGITTTTGTGSNPLALRFFVNIPEAAANPFTELLIGYPIYIYNTGVGSGVTSINTLNTSIVGIGTTFLDNVYIVNAITTNGSNAQIDSNILSTTSVVGLGTTGSPTNICGRFSWGRLSGFTRASSPISIGVTGLRVDAGLTTFPTIQRREYGLRDSGALKKDLG